MRMRKSLLLLTIVLISALLTAQCGGAAPAPAPAPAGGDAPAAAEQPAAGETIKLRFWMHQNVSFVTANEELVRRFKEVRPDVEITLESFPYDVFIQTLQTSMPAGTEADIMQMFGSWVCGYSDRLAEMPDTVMAYAEAQEVFYKAPLDGYYCDGKLYGLPQEYNIENGAVMVNPALFEEAGLTYPPQWQSMDDLIGDAQKLVKYDGNTMTVSGFHFISGDGLAFQFLAGILQRGGEYWKPDGSGLNFLTDEARATLEEMKSWVADDKVTDPFLFNGESNWVGDAFFQNLVGIGFIGPWIVPEGRRQYPEMPFDYVPLPNYAGAEHLFAADSGWGLVVSPNSPQREAAFEFVKFAASQPENARIFNVGTGTVPAVISMAEDPTLLDEIPWLDASLQVLEYGRYVGPLPDRDFFWAEVVYNNVLAVLQDQMTVEQALETIDSTANSMFK